MTQCVRRRLVGSVVLAALALPAAPALADITLYSQVVEPSNVNIGWGFYSSPQPRARRSFKHADNFVLPDAGQVNSVRFWGINEGAFSNGLANYDQFTVEFFTSQSPPGGPGGGLVGSLIHSETFTVAETNPANTGRINPLNNQAEMVHLVTLDTPVNLAAGTQYWIAVSARAINGSGDAWGWRDGLFVNGYSNSFSYATGVWTGFQDTDSSFELIGVPAPGGLAAVALMLPLAGQRRRLTARASRAGTTPETGPPRV